jgi:hypothetical protein
MSCEMIIGRDPATLQHTHLRLRFCNLIQHDTLSRTSLYTYVAFERSVFPERIRYLEFPCINESQPKVVRAGAADDAFTTQLHYRSARDTDRYQRDSQWNYVVIQGEGNGELE